MEIVVTAVGPDHAGLADPIIHEATAQGASIAEIQMYDHDEAAVFAMMCRLKIDASRWDSIRSKMLDIGAEKELSVRVWTPTPPNRKARLAICTTYQESTPRAMLQAIADGVIDAEATVMLGNRQKCAKLAEEFGVPWHNIGQADGAANEAAFVELLDEYAVDYVILARYMRVLPPDTCWKFAGGRIINLHHGLLPSFPGFRPYHDAYAARMLTFGATCHFIVPELDAGNQTINQSTFSVPPGTKLDAIIQQGQEVNEPRCLVEGVRRVVAREVKLHFHRIVAT
ncbi:formyltransferase family protein [Aureliella helgolandensis]|uniref:Formyltetrahydrofolate deformylase n=1 Tax=Aureliella helgolandensis TaxID=2527968 RepID=A0A518G9A4_9BACT|nr:formyltransferase family protein [Aureliella helgolandensis]QDV25149.1 Formyltetrahydrofolate deformylase [Aureliella helgolandensis]